MMAKPARVQITEAATAAGWTTDRGYRLEAEKSAAWAGRSADGERHLHVEFAVNGGIAYACGTYRRYDGPGRLARVLAYVRGER